MTPAELVGRFPGRAFGLLYVERGPSGERYYSWMAYWAQGVYFTSDTDRLADHHHGDGPRAFGSTPEEAIQRLLDADMRRAARLVEQRREYLAAALDEERALREAVTP